MLLTAVSVVYVITGVISRRAQPRNRTGLLFVLVGIGWEVDYLFDDDSAFLLVLAAHLWPAALGHALVAYPTGRLRTLPRRLVVAAGYAESVLLNVAFEYEHEPWGTAVIAAETPMTAVIGGLMLALQSYSWRCSSMAQRRTLTSMLGAAAVAIIVFVVWEPVERAGLNPPAVVLILALSGIPFAYLGGLMRRRMDRGALAELVVRLSGDSRPAGVREALAATLHDPSLRVAYWVAEQEKYVDADGAPVTLDSAHTRVDRGGVPVAVLLHDPVLDLELVDAACAAVGLALENERLTAELRAKVRQLGESRAKVLRAAEDERRRLERNLHDGVQQRLLSVVMTLGLAETVPPERGRALAAEAKQAVLATIDDVRAVCHGIHPPVLTERGLHGAVRELTALAEPRVDLTLDLPHPVPPLVETTAYYVVAEALANVTKHADASRTKVVITGGDGRLVVRVDDDGRGGADPEQGSGLRGLSERVEANGGTMRVVSAESEGTSVRVVLPCG
ncbi:signal transduction histidine kinase [Saccharothrix ecbatanensis]|uniref:histidine kinase n=1 Tax=Saccharothrix ecbatanensis TaxID=1105145 RepID=A0A7W9HE23_9PSEU|nr:sensor histidine kinase [Saccharothrix ecbatanensis]MBB5800495.1 signal transduction histidine kinase [Saccharothrix ecbatanensis]